MINSLCPFTDNHTCLTDEYLIEKLAWSGDMFGSWTDDRLECYVR